MLQINLMPSERLKAQDRREKLRMLRNAGLLSGLTVAVAVFVYSVSSSVRFAFHSVVDPVRDAWSADDPEIVRSDDVLEPKELIDVGVGTSGLPTGREALDWAYSKGKEDMRRELESGSEEDRIAYAEQREAHLGAIVLILEELQLDTAPGNDLLAGLKMIREEIKRRGLSELGSDVERDLGDGHDNFEQLIEEESLGITLVFGTSKAYQSFIIDDVVPSGSVVGMVKRAWYVFENERARQEWMKKNGE